MPMPRPDSGQRFPARARRVDEDAQIRACAFLSDELGESLRAKAEITFVLVPLFTFNEPAIHSDNLEDSREPGNEFYAASRGRLAKQS